MSWLGGNDNTTFLTDLGSLWHNATTGELTPEQKQEISQSTTQELTECSENFTTARCQDLYDKITNDVNIVAPDSNCALRLTDSYCIKSWSSVAFGAIALLLGFLLLQTAISSYPAYARSRGR